MIKGIQVVGILVSMFLLIQTLLNYKKGNYSSQKTFFLSLLWILIFLLFIYPPFVLFVLPILMTKDVISSVLVVGLVVIFFIISNIYQQVGKLDKRLSELVQNLAIHDYLNEIISEENEDK